MTTRTDTIRREPARAYRDTFAPSDPAEPDALPPGWHKLYFTAAPRLDELRPDGTPGRDGVVPDIALPRRLYAGEELTFHRPIRFGETLELTTTLGDVREKSGSSGPLVFVTLESTIRSGAEVVTSIRQRDVFLGDAPPGSAPRPVAGPAEAEWAWAGELTVTPVQLFRFSALTFNSHRIHYDRDWVRDVEGQPDLIVHGPLLELLLLDFCVRNAPDRRVARFSMRAVAPAYVDTPIRLAGVPQPGGARVWALDDKGDVLSTGEAAWATPDAD